jgi:hypothetical protein
MSVSLIRLSLLPLVLVAVLANLAPPAKAQSNISKAYLRHAIGEAGLLGAKFRAANGQDHLTAPGPTATAANRNKVINKTTWLLTGQNPNAEWVETGALKGWSAANGGSTGTTYGNRHYYARQKVVNGNIAYSRVYGGGAGVTGLQNYQITYAGLINGTPYWNFYANGALMGSLDHTRTSFTEMQVGIETNSPCNSFTNLTKSQLIEKRNSAGNWGTWSSLNVVNFPSGLGAIYPTWSSSYSAASNEVTYSNQGLPPISCP